MRFQILQKNISNLLGEKGEKWMQSLPSIIETLSHHWSLTHLQPVKNMTWNFVALAQQNETTPVVLKISFDPTLVQDEYKALKHFNGHGAVKVFDIHDQYNSLLLEQAIPGSLLKDQSPHNMDQTISIYSQVVKKLASIPSANDFTHVNQWCKALDRIESKIVKEEWVTKAKLLKTYLLNTMEHPYICHGDLHLENIIQQNNHWLAIDPKGIIGEIAFEAAAFDLLSKSEMLDTTETILLKINQRITQLANNLKINSDRLLAWFYVRTMLSTQWFIEDKGDPSQALTLIHYLYLIVNK